MASINPELPNKLESEGSALSLEARDHILYLENLCRDYLRDIENLNEQLHSSEVE